MKRQTDQRIRKEQGTAGAVSFPALCRANVPARRIADRLEAYLRVLVEQFDPERIILFGSQARGRPDEHSDVDLLVVRRGVKSRRESNLAMRRAFRGLEPVRLPIGLVTETPESLQERLRSGSHFFTDIVRHGVELYGRPATT